MEQGIINLYKRAGETPLECLTRFKVENPEYRDVPMTYAGRLDPLADGVLIVLAGEARFMREKFLNLDKTYEFESLWGFSSDSYDPLGIVEYNSNPKDITGTLRKILPHYQGEIELLYPKYSSRPLNGIPLFKLAREGKLENVEIPTQHIKIYHLDFIQTYKVNGKELLELSKKKIRSVKGDFRQEESITSWQRVLKDRHNETFSISKLNAHVSSGTYIRSLIMKLGKEIGCEGLAWNIQRSSVRNYSIENSLR